MGRPKTPVDTHHIRVNVTFDPTVLKNLDAYSDLSGIPRSWIITDAVNRYLARVTRHTRIIPSDADPVYHDTDSVLLFNSETEDDINAD